MGVKCLICPHEVKRNQWAAIIGLQPIHSACLVAKLDGEYEDTVRRLDDVVRCEVAKALHVSNGNRRRAAQFLDIPERTLYRKIELYELNGEG